MERRHKPYQATCVAVEADSLVMCVADESRDGQQSEGRGFQGECDYKRKQGKGDTACSAAEVQKGFEIVQCGMRSSKFSVVTSLRFLPADSDVENEKQEAPG